MAEAITQVLGLQHQGQVPGLGARASAKAKNFGLKVKSGPKITGAGSTLCQSVDVIASSLVVLAMWSL